MTSDKSQRLIQLTNQLTETLMTAAICAQELRAEIQEECNHNGARQADYSGRNANGKSRRPLLDQSTLSVLWNSKSLHLGHTRVFWVLERLCRQPNQYVTHLDLLHDVWDNEDLATSTIRSVVRRLRKQLEAGGMADLALAIRGHNGRYIVDL